MKKEIIDVSKIKDALEVLKPDNQLFEIRILKGKTTISGYFTSVDVLEQAFKTVDLRGANIFYTLNVIDPSCYSREQQDRFVQSKTTTSDGDIIAYQWLLIDLDPVRKSGISSSDEELRKAHERSVTISTYLRDNGWPDPIEALSGNGIHLLYAISLLNNKENAQLIEHVLKALALIFNDDKVEVDTSVFNPSRICKLYGTRAQKGTDTKDRPHRLSRLLQPYPHECEVVKKELLEKIAEEYPQEVSAPKTASKTTFDLEGWLDEYGIRVHAVKEWKDATRYVLEECPFDSNHKAPDATIIKMQSGAICFKCLHNSCSGRDWKELRLKYEPDAYDDKKLAHDAEIEAAYQQYKRYKAYNRNRNNFTTETETADVEHPEKMFETPMDIFNKPARERVCILTGLKDFDRKTGGLAKGEISLVSGLRGSAKSTWLSQVAINATEQEYKTVFYSGELKDTRFMDWMMQQVAGLEWIKKHPKYDNYWYVGDRGIKKSITEWLEPYFLLYNNDFGSNFKQITVVLKKLLDHTKADLVVIDNMSILDLSDITDDRRADKWDQQKLFVETLKNLAMICDCHIIFVAHPRKAAGFLRLDDVGGSGSLGNLVDNAFIVHRVNRDFRRGYKRDIQGIIDPKGKSFVDDENEARVELGDNCIEVVKERETGLQDLFIPLWYEKESRRLLNYPGEILSWKWNKAHEKSDMAPWEEGSDEE